MKMKKEEKQNNKGLVAWEVFCSETGLKELVPLLRKRYNIPASGFNNQDPSYDALDPSDLRDLQTFSEVFFIDHIEIEGWVKAFRITICVCTSFLISHGEELAASIASASNIGVNFSTYVSTGHIPGCSCNCSTKLDDPDGSVWVRIDPIARKNDLVNFANCKENWDVVTTIRRIKGCDRDDGYKISPKRKKELHERVFSSHVEGLIKTDGVITYNDRKKIDQEILDLAMERRRDIIQMMKNRRKKYSKYLS